MSAGIGSAGQDKKLWILTDLDRGDDIVGQFIPQDVTKTVAGKIEVGESVNKDYPILQWVSGEVEEVSFRAKLWATDSTDSTVEERLVRLETLVRRNSDLKRPPVCNFSWGSLATLMMDCLVKSIGGVAYDEIREDGTLRGASLQITLMRYEAPDWTVTDPSVPEKFTRIRRAKRGDTYESIALDEFGNALLGVLLRQKNPRKPGMLLSDLRPGDGVHVYPEEHLYTLPVVPQFHAFRSGPGYEKAEENRRRLFDLRNRDRYVSFFADTAEDEFL
jgi:hypothetical protein